MKPLLNTLENNENIGFGLLNGGSNQSRTTTHKPTKKSIKLSNSFHPQNSYKKLTKCKLLTGK